MTDWEGTYAWRKKMYAKNIMQGIPGNLYFLLKCKGHFEPMLSLVITSMTAAKNKHYANTMEFTGVRRILTAAWFL